MGMQAPGEVVREIYALWNADQIEALLELVVPDFEADLTERVFNSDTYRGRDDLRRFVEDTAEVWDGVKVEITELYEDGDQVLAVFKAAGTGLSSGLRVAMEFFQLWTVRDGRAVRFKGYQDRAKAFEEADFADSALG